MGILGLNTIEFERYKMNDKFEFIINNCNGIFTAEKMKSGVYKINMRALKQCTYTVNEIEELIKNGDWIILE
jgi:hypothetical protein